MKENLLIGVLIGVFILVAFAILFYFTFTRGTKSTKGTELKAIEGPKTDKKKDEFYDPTEFDSGIPDFAEKMSGPFDIHVENCFLRSAPDHTPMNIYGTFKSNCLVHADEIYLCTIEDRVTFVGVDARRISSRMIENDESSLTNFNADRDGIVWFSDLNVRGIFII